MKALTICQPYAELICRGDKPIENRSWSTAYRGPLAIHAGRSRAWLDDAMFDSRGLVFGAIVGVAQLVDVQPLDKLPANVQQHEHAFGPYCWLLADVRRLRRPIELAGRQGLWVVDPSTLARITERL
jgi:hypothetical protein